MTRYLAATLAFGLASPAFAGGYVEPAAPHPVAAPVAQSDWTGFYAGGQFELIADGSFLEIGSPFAFELDGLLFGIFAGYRYDLGTYVVGGEIDYLMGSGEQTGNFFGPSDIDYDPLIRAGVEVGYDAGSALVYATVGYAHLGTGDGSAGYYYGVGSDFVLSDTITVGAEMLQHTFDGSGGVPSELDLLTLGLNVAYRF